VAMLVMSTLCSFLLSRIRYRRPMLAGTVIAAISLILLSQGYRDLTIGSVGIHNLVILMVIMAIVGIGMGIANPAANNAILDMVPQKVATVTGMRGMFRITGGILGTAGVCIEDYPSAAGNRRPVSSLEGVVIKVIRPQDMPLQVAGGSFDLAITGRDWLTDHLEQFPSSPVREIIDLKYGRVKIVAVVSQAVAENDIDSLRQLCLKGDRPCRLASEYVNIADRYARDNHLGRYRIIPTWGASEAFLPEDADLLIENTETGGTIARHNLKIIDTLFESTACLIGGTAGGASPVKGRRISVVIEMLKRAVEGS